MEPATITEKRNFFRVNHDVLFDYHGVDAYTANNDDPKDQFDNELPVQLFTAFRQIDKHNQEITRALDGNQKPLLEYLHGLNRKIELLARELVSHKVPDQQKKAKINLSEGGMAFLAEKALYKDTFIAIRLVFLPSYTGVILFARVIRCEPHKGDSHHIAVKFHRISVTQQQLLAKTIMDTQLSSKRRDSGFDTDQDEQAADELN